MKFFIDMRKYDFDKDIFDFPLPIDLNGEELWLMVKAATFPGGIFYTVRGEGIATLHILRIFDDEQEKGTSHFTVMNEDTAGNAVVTAILNALREPLDDDGLPDEEV